MGDESDARMLLARTEEQMSAANRCLDAQLWSAAAASAIRAGKSAADAITVSVAGRAVTDAAAAVAAADELKRARRGDRDCVDAAVALRELMSSEAGVCLGHEPTGEVRARVLVSHAQTLIDVARRAV